MDNKTYTNVKVLGRKYSVELDVDYFDCPDDSYITIYDNAGFEVTSELDTKTYELIKEVIERSF